MKVLSAASGGLASCRMMWSRSPDGKAGDDQLATIAEFTCFLADPSKSYALHRRW
jgi:hypothetical protein